jgi:hypothetical protein
MIRFHTGVPASSSKAFSSSCNSIMEAKLHGFHMLAFIENDPPENGIAEGVS